MLFLYDSLNAKLYCLPADMFTANPYSSQPHMSPDLWSQQAASM